MIKSKETTRAKVFSSTIWTTATKALSQGITFITIIILANLLEKEDFGLMSLALVYMGMIDTFIDFGFMSAIIQARSISNSQLSSCFWILMAVSLLVFSATSLGAEQIAQVLGNERLSQFLKIMAFSLLLIPPQILGKGIISRDLRLDIIAKLEFGASMVRSGTSIFFAYMGSGVWSLVYGFLVEKVVLSGSLLVAAKWRPRLEYHGNGIAPLVFFGMNVTMANILWYVYSKADIFIIGRILGVEILGVYTIALQFAHVFAQFLSGTLNRVIYPLYAKYQQSPQLKEIFIKSSTYMAFLIAPLVIGLASIAQDVVSLFLSDRWQDAVFPIQILSLVSILQIINYLFSAALNATGRPSINTKINFISTFIFCLAFYLGALLWGLKGILMVWVIFYPLRYLVYLVITSRLLKFSVLVYLKRHMGTFLSASIMFIIVILIQYIGISWNIFIRMIICIATGAVTYFSMQAFLSRILMRELIGLVSEMAYPKT